MKNVETRAPHPLIVLVAVLVAALALSAIIWSGSGWPWQENYIDIVPENETETTAYIEFGGEPLVPAKSLYGEPREDNPLTFAITARYLIFPDGTRFRYDVKPGKVIAWNGLPVEDLKALEPNGRRASIYVDENARFVLIYHLLPQFIEAGFSGFNFIMQGEEGFVEWKADSVGDLVGGERFSSPYCLYWDSGLIQIGYPDRAATPVDNSELVISKEIFKEILADEKGTPVLLPGPYASFQELVNARDALWELNEEHPSLPISGFDDPVVTIVGSEMSINPGYWVWDIQPNRKI